MSVCYLYRLYDRADRLLYVGITNNPERRMAEHARYQPWWHEVDRRTILIYEYDCRDDACDLEAFAIQTEYPKYNVVHSGGAVRPVRPRRQAVRDRRRHHPRPRYRRRPALPAHALAWTSLVMLAGEVFGAWTMPGFVTVAAAILAIVTSLYILGRNA